MAESKGLYKYMFIWIELYLVELYIYVFLRGPPIVQVIFLSSTNWFIHLFIRRTILPRPRRRVGSKVYEAVVWTGAGSVRATIVQTSESQQRFSSIRSPASRQGRRRGHERYRASCKKYTLAITAKERGRARFCSPDSRSSRR